MEPTLRIRGGDGGVSKVVGSQGDIFEITAGGGKGGINARSIIGASKPKWATTGGSEHGVASGGDLNITGGGSAGGLGGKTLYTNPTANGQAGGNGGLAVADIDVTAGTSILVEVGAGGAGGTERTSSNPPFGGQPGANGYIIVEY